MEYASFTKGKNPRPELNGVESIPNLNPQLFPFQVAITRWALRLGRAAIFADCGLGKTLMQLEWARVVSEETGRPVLVLAPLAVSLQTQREGDKFGIPVTVCATQDNVTPGVNITNYEKLGHFNRDAFSGLVLDESSILKSFDGVYRRLITEFAAPMRYRLACTATPAPNDLIELTNHSEFLGNLTGKEIVGVYFIQDGNTSHKFRLRKHGEDAFWKWLASWSVAMRAPSDLGFDDDGFILPPLHIKMETVTATKAPDGLLFKLESRGIQERRAARRASLPDRVARCAELVNGSDDQWLVWCDLNSESDALKKAIPGSVEVRGSDSVTHKEQSLLSFGAGDIRVLVTKPTIAGHGMNWQNCHKVAFVGLSDSYEQFYQAVRRCWRFGQESPVDCHVITSDLEGAVVENIKRKERQATEMFSNIVTHMKPHEDLAMESSTEQMDLKFEVSKGDGWAMYRGDSVIVLANRKGGNPPIKDETVGLSVFSPPFPGMYAYSDSAQDVGNCRGIDELIEHFGFMVPDLLRVTMPGRACCIHLAQEPVFKGRDGYVGLRDFRGKVIQLMESHGWIYNGEVTIDKDPQLKAIRTKDHSLLFKTLSTDSSACRPALADYLIKFVKPGSNPVPIPSGTHARWNPTGGWITSEEWIEWAAPVWYRAMPGYPGGIRESDVLNVRAGRGDKDEKHLCPLQLGVIERAVKLWSAPGDLVLSPFAGIGSEGVVALKFDRRFVGVELKESYWRVAVENLSTAKAQIGMFSESTG